MNEENIDNLESLSEYKAYITILEWESDEKKIEAMEKYITNSDYRLDIIKSFSLAENKVKFLKEIKSGFIIDEIISSINFVNDDQRIEIARLVEDESIAYDIIKPIEDDEKKFEVLSLFPSEYYRFEIAYSFKTDEYKIKAMKEYIHFGSDRFKILKSLSKIENIMENIELIKGIGRVSFLKKFEFKNDDEKIKAVRLLDKDSLKCIIIKRIEDLDKKIEALELIKSEEKKVEIIKEIKGNDEKKIELLESISDDENKAIIIKSLLSDEAKLRQLEKINEESQKTQVIISLESDELKIKQLDNISKEKNIAEIICSLKNDEKKLSYLEILNNEDLRFDVILSMKKPELMAEALNKINNEYNKAAIIIDMASNAKFKIKQIEKLNDEFAKTMVIKSLHNDKIKIEQLSSISNDFCKIAIIASLDDKEEKIKLAETINDDYLRTLLIEVSSVEQYDKKTGFPSVSRSNLKEKFLNENRKYTEIGLDKKMTIGMEIESEGILSSIILDLKKIAISEKDGTIRGWETKDDGSLYDGVEVVSPIMSDNKEDIEDIYMICSMLKNGQRISQHCGGHIHIGSDYLTSKEAYINLFEIWGNTEKIIYQMCNENGEIPRTGIQEYAPPISPKLNEALENGTINLEDEYDLDEFIEQIQDIQDERYSGLNLLNINNGKNTIEFRIPNGTINPNVWIENARLFGRIVQMSQRLAVIEKQTEISKEDEHLIELFDTLKQDIPEEQKMEILLELLFTEEERQVYRERYNKCAKRLKEMPDEENPLNKSKFSSVNFKKKHSKEEFHEVAVNSRSGSVNEVVNETKRGILGEPDINKNKENTED